MVITGTDQIVGFITLEVRNELHKSVEKVTLKAGEVFTVSDAFRYAPSVIQAVGLGLIEITLEDQDDAAQEDLTGGGGGGNQTSYKALVLTDGFTIDHDDARTVRITASTTVTSSDTNAIADGSDVGQRMTLIIPGQSQKITILDEANTNLDGDFVAKGAGAGGSGSDFYTFMFLELEWNGSQWVELERKVHVGNNYAERGVAFNGTAKGFKSFAISGTTQGELSTSIGGTAIGVYSLSHGSGVANGENGLAFQSGSTGLAPVSYTISGSTVSLDGDQTGQWFNGTQFLIYNIPGDEANLPISGTITSNPAYNLGPNTTTFTIDSTAATAVANRSGTIASQDRHDGVAFGSGQARRNYSFAANAAISDANNSAAFNNATTNGDNSFACGSGVTQSNLSFAANSGTSQGDYSAAFGQSSSEGVNTFSAGSATVRGDGSFGANSALVGDYTPVANSAGFNSGTVDNADAFACNSGIAQGLASFSTGNSEANASHSASFNTGITDGVNSLSANASNIGVDGENAAAFNEASANGYASFSVNAGTVQSENGSTPDYAFAAGNASAFASNSFAIGSSGDARHDGEFVHGISSTASISQTGTFLQYTTTADATPLIVSNPQLFEPIMTDGIYYDEITILATSGNADSSVNAKYIRGITMTVAAGVGTIQSTVTIGTDYESNAGLGINTVVAMPSSGVNIEVTGLDGETIVWMISHKYTLIGYNNV